MPKLDPSDVDTPTSADFAAANAPLPTTTTPAPAVAKPAAFGGFGNAPTNVSPSGTPAFGAPATGGFGSTGGFGTPAATGGFGSTGGFGGGGFGGAPSQFGGSQGQNQAIDTSAFSSAIAASADKEPEHWMKSFWRPAMGWLYMLTCLCDFVVFPVLWSMMQAYIHGAVQNQWNPITLQGAGLYHLAMGAVLGVAAYGRTQEKKADKQ